MGEQLTMCGLFGYINASDYFTSPLLEKISHELSMRGQHSIQSAQDQDNSWFLMHSRYSTSDLRYPQPIHGEEGIIIHNGVITQENPICWLNDRFTTENDSEILLHFLEDHKSNFLPHLYNRYPNATFAFAYWDFSIEKLIFGRNGKRPLYFQTRENKLALFSTKSIAERSGINLSETIKCEPDSIYTFNPRGNGGLEILSYNKEAIEWQC